MPAPAGPSEDDETVGRNIKRLRGEKGMSQADLARAMQAAGHSHWRQNTVSRIEAGRQKVALDDWEQLGEILGDFMAGTRMARRFSETARKMSRKLLNHRLERVETSLMDALDDVQALRLVYDAEYRDANPELRKAHLGDDEEEADGEHPEA